jgi:hypothetical protein
MKEFKAELKKNNSSFIDLWDRTPGSQKGFVDLYDMKK